MKFFFTTLFQQYYRGFLLRARFVLLLIFAVLLYLTKSSCLQKEKSKLKTREKLKEAYDVKSQFIGFHFFLNHKRVRRHKVNTDVCGSLFNFIVEYSLEIGYNADFEIACNADSRISFETENL